MLHRRWYCVALKTFIQNQVDISFLLIAHNNIVQNRNFFVHWIEHSTDSYDSTSVCQLSTTNQLMMGDS